MTENGSNGRHMLRVLAWPVAILLGLIVVSSIGLVAAALFVTGEAGANIGKILGEAHAISRLVALVIIVPLLGVLCILERVDGAVAAAALSAIAGYVLASTGSSSP